LVKNIKYITLVLPTIIRCLNINKELVIDRLLFAKKRLNQLKRLNNGDLAGSDVKERQQLIQEFFFHLVGSTDFLLQLINHEKGLGISVGKINTRKISDSLSNSDPLKNLIEQLHPDTRQSHFPSNPYSDIGCHFRIILFRNQVCHRGNNPFHFRIGETPR